MKKLLVPLVILVAFTAWSLWLVGGDIVHGDGYLGFLTLARREPWAAQMLTDLVIACLLVTTWMIRDARARGLPSAPYVVATLALGSVGPLAYLVHRGVAAGTVRSAAARRS